MNIILGILLILIITMSGTWKVISNFLIICLIETLALLFSGIMGMIIIGLMIGWVLEKKNV